jgi:hypothetical protein
MSEVCPYCGASHKSDKKYQEYRIYWARLRDISEQVAIEGKSYAPTTWHEQFKRQFIGCIDLPNGQVIGMTTTKMTPQELKEYRWQVEEYTQRQFGVRFTENVDHLGRVA